MLSEPLEVAALAFDQIEVGHAAEIAYTVREEDLEAFARLSGDRSPLHTDEAFARTSRYGTRIAPGMLVAAPLSALVGMCLPGRHAVLLGQRMDFVSPVRIDDVLRLKGVVRSKSPATRILVLDVEVHRVAGGEVVLRGEARVLVEPASADSGL